MEAADPAPGPVQSLRVDATPERVVLAWDPPASEGRPAPTKYYVVRMRVEGRAVVETPRFVARRTLDDEKLPPGTYRYLVGALAPTGSSPSVSVDVRIGAA